MKKVLTTSVCAAMVVTALAASASAEGGYKIGFTNSYNGNSYRQTEEAQMEIAAKELQDGGFISEYTVVEANQDAATQISQIEDFITQGYDLIIVDPASSSTLNNAIQEACDAGIPVITVNDGPVDMSDDNLYQMFFDNVAMTKALTEYVCEQMGGKGNLIELRGTAGTTTDDQFHQGVLDALEQYPDVTIVSEIYTDWTASKAQTELNSVLPTLDTVDGLVTQGGDAYAAVQAFLSAGYDTVPVIAGDNRGSFLNWWANEAPEGYKTLSAASNPWIGAMSLYVAVDLLDGKEVVNDMVVPFGNVTAETLADYTGLGDDEVAFTAYEWDDIRTEIEQQ
ncbi:MAG: substrate-binding domain-containing protein [Eubacteriales bacterium]|nr:substrate-binding domain-containing protein [Eubacteriales bacterium]